MVDDRSAYRRALEDFRKERSRASMQQFWGSVTGKSMDLLHFDEISSKLKATSQAELGLQDIPLKAIVGSVGRYEDFNRNFLPLMDNDIERWARVKTAMTAVSSTGVPPISVYKIGEAYFVLDGNHRVSIARQMGIEFIEAYVTEIKTRVPISANISPAELILKEEYANFLVDTELDKILPEADFSLTFPGQYELLKEHIRVHRYYMGINQEREITYEEAVKDWYEKVYLPLIRIINDSGLLEEFREKTETDLYLWVLDHQSRILEEVGWHIRTENAAADLAVKQGKEVTTTHKKGEQHIDEVLSLAGQASGRDIYESYGSVQPECLFEHILVAINGEESGWDALEQAVRINRCGKGEIRGLHVITEEEPEAVSAESLHARFTKMISEKGISGTFTTQHGEISKILSDRSRLNDLLVLKLNYPPSSSLFDRLSSGFSTILRNVRVPVLVIRESVTDMNCMLLAFDGSSKSKEALYVSAYFAARYGSLLNVITVDDGSKEISTAVENAKAYLDRLEIPHMYLFEKGNISDLIISTIDTIQASLLLLGGYGRSSMMEVLLGSEVDSILRKIKIPALICH